MVCTKISLTEFKEEVADMLRVCFEGTVSAEEGSIRIAFPNGQEFRVSCSEQRE